ncbi:MAG TPA: Maf family protein, partial [Planctomycetaceae bacterium]
MQTWFILASRSPRRRELLGLAVPADQIIVVPPSDASEAGFDGLHDLPSIEQRLAEIARAKADDVLDQLSASECLVAPGQPQVVIAADTTIVAHGSDGRLHVIGQPPEDDSWKEVVRTWFRDYFAGRAHLALTVLCVRLPGDRAVERLTKSGVVFVTDVEQHLEWYIETGEPRGKAGGYAIQAAGSIFVSHVKGSLTNVIGLPLEALL